MGSAVAELMRSTDVISEMMSSREIEVVLEWLERTLSEDVPGDVVELGCNCGTTSIFIAKLLERCGGARDYHVYDSFAGLPASGPRDRGHLAAGTFSTGRDEFVRNLLRAGVERPPHVHEAFFDRLAPNDLPDAVSFAFLDGDLYDSISTSLGLVYPRLQTGAAVVVDDYGFSALPGVERACAHFFADRPEPIQALDGVSMAAIVKR